MNATLVLLAAMIAMPGASGQDQILSLRAEAGPSGPQLLEVPAGLVLDASPLSDALLTLERTSGVRLAFSSSLLPDRTVSCRCAELTVGQALDELLEQTGLRFEAFRRHVVIEPDPGREEREARNALPASAGLRTWAILSQPVRPRVPALQGNITGRITDAQTGGPLAGVQIDLPEIELGTLSQPNGRFLLTDVPVGTYEIRVQLIGYQVVTRQVTVPEGGTVEVNFELREQALALDEIVVTGTAGGTQRRAIGNVVENINVGDVLSTAPVQTMQQLLGQRTTGMVQLPSAGQVGTGSPIRIRGLNSMSLRNGPLVYIDGIRMDSDPRRGPGTRGGARISRLNDLNPQDIESIEIIKGPSAATLYGTEASNGVIQIITKRGSEGAPRFDVVARTGANWMVDPEGRTPIRFRRNPQTGELEGFNILRQERINGLGPVFETGLQQGYDVSLSGGTDAVRYYTSGSWGKEEGVFGYDESERLNIRANLELLLTENLSLTTTAAYLETDVRLSQNGGFGAEPFSNIIWNFPATLDSPQRGWFVAPPEEWSKVSTVGENDRTLLSLEAEHRPFDWFTHRLTAGLDLNKEENSELWPRQPEGSSHFWGSNALGVREVERLNHRQLTLDYAGSAIWERSSDVTFTTSAGLQYTKRESSGITAEGSVFPAIPITTVSGGAQRDGFEDFIENATLGVYVQEELNWRNRVFLTAAVRGDDNSAFGTDFDAAIYPKASATWVLHEEPFWDVDWVDQLRLRTAWGAAGQQPGTFDAPRLFDPEIGFGDEPALVPSSFGNPQLEPERSQELEFGFDLSLLDDRLEVVYTRYNRWVEDAIVERPLPPSSGFSGFQIVNIGEVSGSGNELGVNARVIETSDFGWDLGVQVSNNENTIDDLGPGLTSVQAGTQQENVVGFPIGSFFFRHLLSAEIDDEGNVIEALCDGGTGPNGRLPGGSAVPCGEAPRLFGGESHPTWQLGINNTFTLFDDLRFYARVEGNGGHLGFNSEMRAAHNIDITEEVLCRCIPRVQATRAFENNVMGIYEAGFVRLREVGASYNLPAAWVDHVGAAAGSLSFAARNLLMIWTKEHGFDTFRDGRVMARDGLGGQWTWDPEIRSTGSVASDFQTVLPPLASATFTVRLSF